ncbi:hypothetical protein AVEN_192396-1 [Araneus ventricosus]|uniref:Uncharacterized protein n=1 Tax=Araneus ventricosus TaxID=182803 RepID=A0A4Y2H5M3_ARAVE|nr:hypothetical protein AVEN_192396-1 [Araneus ventricosus]
MKVLSIFEALACEFLASRSKERRKELLISLLFINKTVMDEIEANPRNRILKVNERVLINISFHSPKIIQRLAAKIHIRKNLNKKIALLWVPGHSGVSWNEKADSIAKQVSDFSPYIDWIASEDILSHLKKQSFQITEENYHKSKYQLLIGNIPDILTISKWTGNRVQDRLIARIISKTITTPGLSRFNLRLDPLCRVCNEINDISHILLRCQKYASVRVILWKKLNIVSANIPYDILLSHVLVNKNHLLIFVQTLKYFDID